MVIHIVNRGDEPSGPSAAAQAVVDFAKRNNLDYRHVLGVLYRETAGTLDANMDGGGAAKGRKGLIQFGKKESDHYGYHPGMTFAQEMAPDGPVEKYLKERFSWDGKKLGKDTTAAELYAAILAGRPHLTHNGDRNGSAQYAVESGQLKQFAKLAAAKLGVDYDDSKPFDASAPEHALAFGAEQHRGLSSPAGRAIESAMGHYHSQGRRRQDHWHHHAHSSHDGTSVYKNDAAGRHDRKHPPKLHHPLHYRPPTRSI